VRLVRRSAGAVLVVGGVLVAEVAVTLSHTFLGAAESVAQDASYGAATDPALTLLVLGDSTAAGVGATDRLGTVSGHLATALAAQGRHVTVVSVAVSGAVTGDLAGQIARLPTVSGTVVALVQIGANDTTHLVSTGTVKDHLGAALSALEARGARVVVATCPDMGAARPFPQPLRWIAGWRGRAIGHAEADVVRRRGGIVVPLAELTGPRFRSDRAMLASDGFHPSDEGYALWAASIQPYVEEALGA
jgi:lysophospholipase L1-like esterase